MNVVLGFRNPAEHQIRGDFDSILQLRDHLLHLFVRILWLVASRRWGRPWRRGGRHMGGILGINRCWQQTEYDPIEQRGRFGEKYVHLGVLDSSIDSSL